MAGRALILAPHRRVPLERNHGRPTYLPEVVTHQRAAAADEDGRRRDKHPRRSQASQPQPGPLTENVEQCPLRPNLWVVLDAVHEERHAATYRCLRTFRWVTAWDSDAVPGGAGEGDTETLHEPEVAIRLSRRLGIDERNRR